MFVVCLNIFESFFGGIQIGVVGERVIGFWQNSLNLISSVVDPNTLNLDPDPGQVRIQNFERKN